VVLVVVLDDPVDPGIVLPGSGVAPTLASTVGRIVGSWLIGELL
jgi:hypothetical protein